MENYRYIFVYFCMLSVLSTQVIALKFDLSTVSNAVWEIIRYYQVNLFFSFFKGNEVLEKKNS